MPLYFLALLLFSFLGSQWYCDAQHITWTAGSNEDEYVVRLDALEVLPPENMTSPMQMVELNITSNRPLKVIFFFFSKQQ